MRLLGDLNSRVSRLQGWTKVDNSVQRDREPGLKILAELQALSCQFSDRRALDRQKSFNPVVYC